MRGWDFTKSHIILLDGQWEFYPNQFLSHTDMQERGNGTGQLTYVPGDWGSAFGDSSSNSYGYGTYRLRILVDPAPDMGYAFWIQQIEAASEIEINGKLQASFGELTDQKETYNPKVMTYLAYYQAQEETTEIELLVRAANFDYPYKGGIVESIRFGSEAAIDTKRMYSIGFQLVTFTIMLMHALYAVILFSFRPMDKSFLIFFLLLLAVSFSIISDHDRILLIWLSMHYDWSLKIKLLSYMYISFFVLVLSRSFSGNYRGRRLFRIYCAALALYTLFMMAAPISYVYWTTHYGVFSLFYLPPLAWFVYIVVFMVIRKQQDAVFLLFSATSIASSVIWGVFVSNGLIDSIYYPIDILAAMVGFSTYWFKRYFRNSAENEKLNAQLKQSDKMKDEFLANTSHELRTPLHGIMNIAHTILTNEKQVIQEKSQKDMQLLLTISRRMSYLLDDLLDVVRLQDKRILLRQEPLHIQSIVPGVMDMLGYMTEGKQVTLQMKIADTFPPVWADEKRFVQILFNLLHNALKYTKEGVIEVTAEEKDGYAFIRVSDTGAGMDVQTQARIFEAYEQGPYGVNKAGGIGLGLSICKQLVQLHGGELFVLSQLGQGSVFTFTLPLAHTVEFHNWPSELEESHAAAEYQVAASISGLTEEDGAPAVWTDIEPVRSPNPETKLNILAVDDDVINLKVLDSILNTGPYHIRSVMSSQEALEQLARGKWDLLIADVMMPSMSGYELTKKVRERYSISELPILLLTARGAPADMYAGFQAGASDYVTKPVDALELRYRVWSLTSLKRSVDERLRMEAAYLQAQIHPHFLFNTLNSILALSELDTEKMQDLGEAFTSYLRVSFDFLNAGELVPLSHELELVNAYLYIEKARFEERLTIVWEVEPDLELMLPPLTIQPLVENAVKHGLLSSAKGVTVLIRIKKGDGAFQFEIADDGKGMEAELVNQLLDRPANGRKGIGLFNTNRRLVQMYGKGLLIDSKPGVGTTIRYTVPVSDK